MTKVFFAIFGLVAVLAVGGLLGYLLGTVGVALAFLLGLAYGFCVLGPVLFDALDDLDF